MDLYPMIQDLVNLPFRLSCVKRINFYETIPEFEINLEILIISDKLC